MPGVVSIPVPAPDYLLLPSQPLARELPHSPRPPRLPPDPESYMKPRVWGDLDLIHDPHGQCSAGSLSVVPLHRWDRMWHASSAVYRIT